MGKAFRVALLSGLCALLMFPAEAEKGSNARGAPERSLPLYLLPHFHFDSVWHQPQGGYCEWALEVAQTYLEACLEDPEFRCLLSELDYLRPLYDTAFGKRDALARLFASGRILAGFSYNQPNDSHIGGEAFLRNLLYARYFHEGVLGSRPTAYLALDVFGHQPQLPSLCAGAGLAGMIWSKTAPGFPQNFWRNSKNITTSTRM